MAFQKNLKGEETPMKENKFNMAFFMLETLHRSFINCINSALNNDMVNWHKNVLAVNRILSPFMSEEDEKEILKLRTQAAQVVGKLNNSPNSFIMKNKAYSVLNEMEIKLRKITYDAGLYMATESEFHSVFGGN